MIGRLRRAIASAVTIPVAFTLTPLVSAQADEDSEAPPIEGQVLDLSSDSEIGSLEDFQFLPSITSTDNADGTYDIPLLKSDVPDVSVARVPADENNEGRDFYYMVSTTMHLSPGAPIMKSYDLVNWEIVNYAYDRLSIEDEFSLRDGQSSYGSGQWASSIRYHEGTTYILFNTNNLGGAYMLYTDDPENDGNWERVEFGRGMHDPTLFFDEANDGAPYVFYGNGAQTAVKLDPENGWQIDEEYPDIFKQSDYDAEWTKGLFEGSQLAYINGMYYMVMITSGSGWSRQVLVLRSPYLLGRYDERSDGQNTYEDHSGLNSNGYAQGCLVEVDNGDGTTGWHGFFFRDTYPGGRIPALIPAVWTELEDVDEEEAGSTQTGGWPVFGDEGEVGYPDTFEHLITLDEDLGNVVRSKSIVTSDDFYNDAGRQSWTHEYERWGLEGDALEEIAYNGSDLRPQWEWNHAPDNRFWSLTDREGWLRLAPPSVVTGEAQHRGGGDNEGGLTYLEEARNTLGQRAVFPQMSAETHLDFSELQDGDTAGLAIYQRAFTYAAARNVDGQLSVGLVERTPSDVQDQLGPIDAAEVEQFTESVSVPEGQSDVYLRVDTAGEDGSELSAWWYYSWDGEEWHPLGGETKTAFSGWQPTHFMGPRVGLFNYATKDIGGHADFDYLYVSDADPEAPVSTDRLEDAIAYAEGLDPNVGSCDLAQDVEFWLGEAKRAREEGIYTHTQSDAAVERLQLAMAEYLASDSEGECSADFTGALSVSSVVAGGDVRVSGSGGSGLVSVSIDGAEIGSGEADEDGDYSFVVTVPASLAAGLYVVTVSDESGASWTAELDVTDPDDGGPGVPDGQVAVSGEPVVGEELTAGVSEWPEDTEFTYQWLVGGDASGSDLVEIDGASDSSLVLVDEYAGKWIGVRVSAEHPDLGEARVVDSALVGPVVAADDGAGDGDGDGDGDGSGNGDLPATGASVVGWVVLGVVLLGSGIALQVVRQRRKGVID